MQLLSRLTALLVSLLFGACSPAQDPPGETLRVLVVAGGGYHDFKGNTDALCRGLSKLGRYDFRLLRQGPGPFPESLPDAEVGLDAPDLGKHYDVIMAYSQGELGWSAEEKAGFLRFIEAGGGYVALHCAGDSHPGWSDYDAMLGGRFVSHPPYQKIAVETCCAGHEVLRGRAGTWEIEDEFYHLKGFRPHDKVLLQRGVSPGDGASRPVSWVRDHGAGRVFYTILGHARPTHVDERFQRMVHEALRWCADAPKPRPDGCYALFDGKSLNGWRQVGPGEFTVEDGALVSKGGMGLLFWEGRRFADFELSLQWSVSRKEDNSGVFVRFPAPPTSPWDAVKEGYEIQICDAAGPKHRTGSIYDFEDAASIPTVEPGAWNRLEVTVRGQKFVVKVNGKTVTRFTGERGIEGYVGLQNHDDSSNVRFRDVTVRPLER